MLCCTKKSGSVNDILYNVVVYIYIYIYMYHWFKDAFRQFLKIHKVFRQLQKFNNITTEVGNL